MALNAPPPPPPPLDPPVAGTVVANMPRISGTTQFQARSSLHPSALFRSCLGPSERVPARSDPSKPPLGALGVGFDGTERAGTRSDGRKQGQNSADGCGVPALWGFTTQLREQRDGSLSLPPPLPLPCSGATAAAAADAATASTSDTPPQTGFPHIVQPHTEPPSRALPCLNSTRGRFRELSILTSDYSRRCQTSDF